MTEKIIRRAELCEKLNVKTECVRRWIKAGKIPPPDIMITHRTTAWRLSTLQNAGINF